MSLSRLIWCTLGLACTGLGFIGLVLPGLPTTIFLILAVACFKRGHRGFELWLLNHKWFGAGLRDWDANQWISPRVKLIACSFMLGFSLLSALFMQNQVFRWGIPLLGVIGCAYVLTRRTRPGDAPYPGPVSLEEEKDRSPLGGRAASGGPLEALLKNESPGKVVTPAVTESDAS